MEIGIVSKKNRKLRRGGEGLRAVYPETIRRIRERNRRMKETILLINFNDTARRNQVKRALMPLRLRLKSVGPDQYDLPVGVLAGEKQTGQQRDQQEGKPRALGERT